MNPNNKKQLSEKDRLESRTLLRLYDAILDNDMVKIGRPSSFVVKLPDVRRQWFGIELMLLAPFILILCMILPNDSNRWLVFGFGWLTLFLGAWQVDLSRK